MPRLNQPSVASGPLQWSTRSVSPQAAPARFAIGRDSLGGWTVTDREDHVGGTFVSEAAAFSFARQEADHDISQICRSPDGVVVEFPGIESGMPQNRRLALATHSHSVRTKLDDH